MFSKKILRFTLLSLVAQLVYMNFHRIPDALVRPVIIVSIILVLGWFYLYSTGNLTEEKLVEGIAEKRDQPLANLHKSNEDGITHLRKPNIEK